MSKNIYWRDVREPIIDYLSCFCTESGDLIFWNGDESYTAQSFLQRKSISKNTIKPMAKELSQAALECLKNCTIDGNNVSLPSGQLERNIYVEVKNRLELIGGKWKGGKVSAFVFNEDPTEYLEQLQNGENRNLKKEFQFFATPDSLCDRLVELANPSDDDVILEPSAGQGAIIKAIKRYCDPVEVFCYELMPVNQTFIGKIDCATLLGEDFLSHEGTMFDIIIANPPFAKNQDIDHVMHMYKCLKQKGRLVSITSNHWINSTNKKETSFREFLKSVDANIIPVDAGEFKESGTNIATSIVVINKN